MAVELREAFVRADASKTVLATRSSEVLAAQGTQLLERRSEVRYPTRDVVEVRILEKGSWCSVAATIVDVSRSGLRIELRSPIAKGSRIEIILGRALVIFGEVRYCRRGGEAVYAGILIQQVDHARPVADKHINDDVLSCYLVGKGLTVPEVIGLKEHLILCEACKIRLAEADAILHPIRRRKSWAHLR
jgi:hypothetical protein